LSSRDSAVKKYTGLLESRQKSLEGTLGFKALYHYTVALNGFAAHLTSAQATRLARTPGVSHVTPNRILRLQQSLSTDYLNVSTQGGVWDSIGGAANAGAGVVVGDIDTGIAPENPSFAGDPLQSSPAASTTPTVNSGVVSFVKGDGATFTSTEVPGQQWNASDYSTKIIGARYFVDGFGVGNIASPTSGEYISPRDGNGHGSHTASTAAGNVGVAAAVDGQNYGEISGVAPAAKISVYKACWTANPTNPNLNDGCATADLVAAINQAVTDGVDILNFSIGADPATTVYSPTDQAFLNAATAGVFVSVAAANNGPNASTVDNVAPWETTVAATTIPSYQATAILGNGRRYAGASVTVNRSPVPARLSARLVLGDRATATGVSSTAAKLCAPGSLSAARTVGKIVVCDRGGSVGGIPISETDKSATVLAAGGVGMILLNTGTGSGGLDQHSVPTINLGYSVRTAVRAYAAGSSATVRFIPYNVAPGAAAVPQLATFSSRGPALAGGSDVLKPDVAAPGVLILAATANPEGAAPTFGFESGTSMATPHVSGLAAVYLGVHPLATPSEIKSALQTTAGNVVDGHGHASTSPFGEGAGQVVPSRFLNPGLLYLNGPDDWKAYLEGAGVATFGGISPIDPSDLNLATIAIGDLAGTQSVTRTVTSQGAGTYKASISVPGIRATVSPSSLSFAGAGESHSFTVTFARTTAALDKWATGFLTWSKSGSNGVRSAIAVHPTSLVAPRHVNGTGTGGTASFDVTPGATASIHIQAVGLAEAIMTPNAGDSSLGYTDVADNSVFQSESFLHHVSNSTSFVRFAVDPLTTTGTDLDLYILYSPVFSSSLSDYRLVAQSATSAAGETVDINKPAAGYYIATVDYFSTPPGGVQYRELVTQVDPTLDTGNFRVSPTVINAIAGTPQTLGVRWGGLRANSSYVGFVRFGAATTATEVDVTTGGILPPVSVSPPTIAGPVVIGGSLSTTGGTWDALPAALSYSYEWKVDGVSVSTAATYTPIAADLGRSLTVEVTASLSGGPAATAASAGSTVLASSSTSFTFAQSTISPSQRAVVTVTVLTSPPGNATGTVRVRFGSWSRSAAVDATGVVSITLPPLPRHAFTVIADYLGGPAAAPSSSAHRTLTVR
jgi:subtilisin family serine protease